MSRFSNDFIRRSMRNRFKLKSSSNDSLRLCAFRSERNIAVQLIDDDCGKTLCSVSSLSKDLKGTVKGSDKNSAFIVGQAMAKKVIALNIDKGLYFDRGGFAYHGRIKALADGMRDGGLRF